MAKRWRRRIIVVGAIVLAVAVILTIASGARLGNVVDEAKLAGRDHSTFPAAAENYFHDMDGGIALTDEEVRGRNMWILWTGGNDRFWDKFNEFSFGTFDLLKVLSSYPGLKFSRENRFEYLGLINEPCFTRPTRPDESKFGLWFDRREPSCAPDPFENEAKYPGVKVGARGSTVPVGSYFGMATGVVGLRLFSNPEFDEAAKKAWDPVRYYTDPSYYNDRKLVRPYRVGMSCAFCHVGPNPLNPPADPERPKWENLSSLVGAQYFWVDRIFNYQADKKNFIFQILNTARPGALDTSLVSTDYINNPRTMNAIYEVPARLKLALDLGKHQLVDGNLDNKQFNDVAPNSPLAAHFKNGTGWVPHVQKDASDSVGALGALNRVYLNIGLFSEEWLLHFNPIAGGKPISPIRIKDAQKNSSYWRATEEQTPAMAAFLMKAGSPHRLADAPGGVRHMTAPTATVDRGKVVFAETCARCHSSKYPQIPPAAHPDACMASNYLECWNNYWAWTKTPDFKSQMTSIVQNPDFLKDNFLSNEMRVPTTLLQTNLCSPLATNAVSGSIWDEFSSASYKALPSVGEQIVTDPISGKPRKFTMPAGGRGYSRPASLVSVWSTAPFLLNNSLGRFEADPSVDARMRSFDDSIRKLLWPDKREMDTKFGAAASGLIDRLSEPAYFRIPTGHLPGFAKTLLPVLAWGLPDVFASEPVRIQFTGSTAQGSTVITKISIASPLTSFNAGAPVSGPGIPSGARIVVFDGATQRLTIDNQATATAEGATLATDAPDVALRVGPIPAGTPVSLFTGIELSPETGGWVPTILHELSLAWKLAGLPATLRKIEHETDPQRRESMANEFQSQLYSENKCPDLVINRGHYFGTDKLGEEPGLSDPDKEALIAFLKTF
jgi:hypothetical protein